MKIGVIGAGAWGTALAQVAAHGDRPVRIWARNNEPVNLSSSGCRWLKTRSTDAIRAL